MMLSFILAMQVKNMQMQMQRQNILKAFDQIEFFLQKETKAKSYFAIDELITTLDKCTLFFTHKFCWTENRDIGKKCLKTKTKSTDLHDPGK